MGHCRAQRNTAPVTACSPNHPFCAMLPNYTCMQHSLYCCHKLLLVWKWHHYRLQNKTTIVCHVHFIQMPVHWESTVSPVWPLLPSVDPAALLHTQKNQISLHFYMHVYYTWYMHTHTHNHTRTNSNIYTHDLCFIWSGNIPKPVHLILTSEVWYSHTSEELLPHSIRMWNSSWYSHSSSELLPHSIRMHLMCDITLVAHSILYFWLLCRTVHVLFEARLMAPLLKEAESYFWETGWRLWSCLYRTIVVHEMTVDIVGGWLKIAVVSVLD